MSPRSSRFWTGGREAYYSGLRQYYGAQLAALRKRLRECTTLPERDEIHREIKAVEAEFKEKVGGIGRLIF